MDWINVVGLMISVAGLIWAYIGHRQNKKLESLIVAEKVQISDRILDIRQNLKSRRDQVVTDRQTRQDPTLDTAGIRIEDLDAWMEILQRFADRLQGMK